ncbi:alkaline phosphatase family protein [Vibrio mangrovi]|uniref:Alkaline phosphatase family protein n=1 Tax=Vibrio mangrovi TaxID=474394 RepID=A0A1Y6IMZ2_9VIBR|nr:alkaline phosphatase family protein [Vibrio mangrovi]MDW6004169.1 alkaline phosphatase family protein [Vibrio mangrovi]SMR99034.1 Type I phosphodiesterase / nucleotide pyrophosphatase [Vibrio mangrovi]
MSNKVILVVLDGLNHSVARQCLGYLNGLIESQQATLYPITCELPSLSRPLYECLLTGVRPVESGIVHNYINRCSEHESVFSLARQQGRKTAAAAYHWVSELYNRSPYHPVEDRFTDDPALNIQHGLFYHWDHYPDEALFLDGEHLRRRYDPDFLLIHPMNIDDSGHQYGLDSPQYRNTARKADMILSDFLPQWIAAGYQILITSDHGMNNDGSHGGTLAEEREVPLFVIGDRFSHQQSALIAQTDICGVLCELLGLLHDKPSAEGILR